MANPNKVPDFTEMAKKLKKDAYRKAEVTSVQFFKESFRKKGFTNSSFEAWAKTSNPFMGSGTLYNEGNLMRSLQKNDSQSNENTLVIESTKGYANIHNEGGEIVVTAKMKKFFWAKYCEIAGIKKNDNGKTDWNDWSNIKKHKSGNYSSLSKSNKSISQKAKFFKKMALMKVGSKIKIPKRQFIGHSNALMSDLEKWFVDTTDENFKDVVASNSK